MRFTVFYLVPIIKGTAKVVKQDIPGENQLIVHRFAVIKCLIWQPCHSSAQIPPRSPTLLRETRLSTQWTRKSDLAESQDQITWHHRSTLPEPRWQSIFIFITVFIFIIIIIIILFMFILNHLTPPLNAPGASLTIQCRVVGFEVASGVKYWPGCNYRLSALLKVTKLSIWLCQILL